MGVEGAPARPGSARDLEFMMRTSSRVADHVVAAPGDGGGTARTPHAEARAGDVLREGYAIVPVPGSDAVVVERCREVVAEELPGGGLSVTREREGSSEMPFAEFAASGWMERFMEAWGDGDADSSQVGRVLAFERDGDSVRADMAVAARDGGWPRRPAGRNHDEAGFELRADGTVLAWSSARPDGFYDGGMNEMLDLVAYALECRAAGVRVEGGRVSVPAAGAGR